MLTVLTREREFFIANVLVRIHVIIVMIGCTGLAPWDSEFPFPCSLITAFLITKSFRATKLLSVLSTCSPF